MHIRPWKYKFSQEILERGEGYQLSNQIKEYSETDNEIFARVQGYDLYEVHIELKNGKIDYMSCTCPYAKRGARCKHEAAVLYEAMNHRDRSEIRELSEEDIDLIMFEYEGIYEDSVDQEGDFITEWDDDEEGNQWYFLVYDTVDFLKRETEELLADHLYMTALKVIIRTYADAHQYAYDCDEGLDLAADTCADLIKEIYAKAPQTEAEKLKKEAMSLLKKIEDKYSEYDDKDLQRVRRLIHNCELENASR